MGSVNAMTEYQKSFGLNGAGASTGLIFIIYSLGSLGALPFSGFLSDTWGRRLTIFIGCVIILLGTGIQTAAKNQHMFIAGRFILGFGAALAQAAAPVYIIEIAHPSYRGIQGGMYNNFWWVGNSKSNQRYTWFAFIMLTYYSYCWMDHLWLQPDHQEQLGVANTHTGPVLPTHCRHDSRVVPPGVASLADYT
jgi:MFS family permease